MKENSLLLLVTLAVERGLILYVAIITLFNSSLLSAIIGEVPMKSGEILRGKNVAYVPQQVS
jgi:hypothetical protein